MKKKLKKQGPGARPRSKGQAKQEKVGRTEEERKAQDDAMQEASKQEDEDEDEDEDEEEEEEERGKGTQQTTDRKLQSNVELVCWWFRKQRWKRQEKEVEEKAAQERGSEQEAKEAMNESKKACRHEEKEEEARGKR